MTIVKSSTRVTLLGALLVEDLSRPHGK